jgi:2-polyprenyl-3-methyl-5-hydroxy-6-metoxy-1,4-benzoquinol methylase
MKKTAGYYSQSRKEMLDYMPEMANCILEVGCGSGAFGLHMRRSFPKARLYGIEIDPDAAKEAAGIYEQVWEGDVCAVLSQSGGRSFDLIVFNDILEHIVDPWLCLKLARDLLLPNGQVVASIPNMRFWPILSDLFFQGNWNYRDAGVMDRTHLRFFTRKSIHELFNCSGYRIVSICGINETWKKSLRWRVINAFFAGRFQDCLFPQFAIVAIPDS